MLLWYEVQRQCPPLPKMGQFRQATRGLCGFPELQIPYPFVPAGKAMMSTHPRIDTFLGQ